MNYLETHFVIALVFTGVTTFILAVFVSFKNHRRSLNVTFALYSLSISWWSLTQAVYLYYPVNHETALFWGRLEQVGVFFIPSFFLHFIMAFLGIPQKKVLRLIYAFSCLFGILSATPLMIEDEIPKFYMQYFGTPGIGYHFAVLFFLICIGYGLYLLRRGYLVSESFKRIQIKYLFWSSLFGYLGGSASFLLVYDISIPVLNPFGTYFVGLYALVVAYSIFRYRLMDIRVVITRTGIFVAVYTLVLGIPFALALWARGSLILALGGQWWTVPLAIMAVLATAGPFVYSYIEHKAENTLLKEQKRYQRTLKQASVGMTRIRNLRRLLDLIAHIVTKTVRISYAAIYLYNPEANQYELQVHRGQLRSFIPRIAAYSPIITSFRGTYEALVYDEVKRKAQESQNPQMISLEQSMHAIPSAVIIPSFLEARLMGFIVLGEKVSGHIYTPEDLNVFQVLASQAALAIENAQFYEEAKTMQEQIAQAEKMATIGTMADGLSHQINNRFYALSLIASDSIDTIKMTDTANCSPEIKEMLAAVSKALERIQVNVMQGGEVVKGILKYTRKGDEGFEALSLDQVLDGTIDMIKYKIKISKIDIVRDIPDDAPKIKGNQVQLQEAFFNLLDNAYDATVERESTLEEKDYRGKIVISLKPLSHSRVQITIKDNGMGVKDQNAKKLFTPFFTTKTSSRKGTGLGLYVIKRIISEIHGGSISVESVYKQGTTFTLELPVAL